MPKSRRRVIIPIVALLVAALVGCGSPGTPERERPLVLATFTVIADIARNVAGNHLDVESITKVGAEIHGYEPTPGDLRRAAGADLIIDNGLGLEAWFEQFLQDVDAPRVTVSDGIQPIDIAADAYAGRPNPHAWMSPVNVEIYVDNLVVAFSDLDPAHAVDYAANGEAYRAELRAVQDELVEDLDALPADARALVTCEGAFSYLARDTGLTEIYIWPVNAEQQATPQQIAGVIDAVEADDIPAVFCESTVSDRPMQQVVEATGADYGGVLYVDSLSEAGGPVPTYLDMLRYNARTITDALTGGDG
ncbi:metal ABC transporter substrate-binding protein [Pseudolysinimonas sp.]|uniref:metal ABC transporter substrate-binding protein n=1 Tax=Pseudolysinimonas sp. TaxID=2680009 RepID=UPI00286B33FB|nr:metal ABC transporter substrate-binding protein [Pseudolysinimonas sp.]